MKNQLVKEWMTTEVLMVGTETTLTELHGLMMQEHVRHLPVVNQGRVVGIVSRGDMRSALSLTLSDERGVLRLVAEEIMTPDPMTISGDAPMAEAAKIMLHKKISGLPVVDEAKQLVGIVTESDVLRLVVENSQQS